jgi:hypothetical protein
MFVYCGHFRMFSILTNLQYRLPSLLLLLLLLLLVLLLVLLVLLLSWLDMIFNSHWCHGWT